ncbi:MAG: EcsC family protein [Calothrix sp. MO_192.B10]|nr:EcsC family protein [Calothrix sp. MO_192.B10]
MNTATPPDNPDDFGLMKMPVIGQAIGAAINDGKKWGQKFLNEQRWSNNWDKMANHAIYESTLWSVGSGIGHGFVGIAGIPSDVSFTLYSQVKLASTLFTIYGIDTTSESAKPLILAAAAGVTVSELASQLGTRVASQAIHKALMSVSSKTFNQINKTLGIKLISKAGEKTILNVAKIVPIVGSAVGGTVNGVMMNACGHSVIQFIKVWQKF